MVMVTVTIAFSVVPSKCPLVGSFFRKEKQSFLAGAAKLNADLLLDFRGHDELHLRFDVALTAMGDVEKCQVLGTARVEERSDGRLNIDLFQCRVESNHGNLPVRRQKSPLWDSIERSCQCPTERKFLVRHTWSNACKSLRFPLPDFDGIDPVFTRQSGQPKEEL
jgi:hypothetical protein